MKAENLSVEAISQKLKELKEEHARFDEQSNILSSKKVFTPGDELELNTLRKKKLQKKDMIAYYEDMLKKAK